MHRRLTAAIGPLAIAPVVIVVIIAILATGCASTGAVPKPFPTPAARGTPAPQSPPGTQSPQGVPAAAFDSYAVVGTALAMRGVPYRNGGADPHGFDCSGFTQYVFARHGVGIPREVRDQFQAGIPVQPADLQAGDLLFFSTTAPGASHVGIAIGGDQFVHAPSSTGVVRVERMSAAYWSRRWLGARRLD